MDRPTLDWLNKYIYLSDVICRDVLEVGSRNVNGSVRDNIQIYCNSYTGVDIEPGIGVDEICSVYQLASKFDANSFDIVISTEMLEHLFYWQDAITQLKNMVKPGGYIILTTRRPGFPRHGYPNDYWRFSEI